MHNLTKEHVEQNFKFCICWMYDHISITALHVQKWLIHASAYNISPIGTKKLNSGAVCLCVLSWEWLTFYKFCVSIRSLPLKSCVGLEQWSLISC